MPIDESTTFEISTRGEVDDNTMERAQERLTRVGTHCRETIIHVELRVTDDATHLDQDNARAEATLSLKHGPVRAHAQAPTAGEAIDIMVDRLRRRLDRHESRLHRGDTKRHDGVASEGSWRHGDVNASPRHPTPLPDASATVVRRKTFAASPMSVEEAAFDLDVLDHDFYLFEEIRSGEPGLLSIRADGRYQLEIPAHAKLESSSTVPLERVDGPPLLDDVSAQRLLDNSDTPFVFHRTGNSETVQVTYRRYDGNYGVVELGLPGSSPTSP